MDMVLIGISVGENIALNSQMSPRSLVLFDRLYNNNAPLSYTNKTHFFLKISYHQFNKEKYFLVKDFGNIFQRCPSTGPVQFSETYYTYM